MIAVLLERSVNICTGTRISQLIKYLTYQLNVSSYFVLMIKPDIVYHSNGRCIKINYSLPKSFSIVLL